jgi:hypothetical protein
MRQQLQQVRRRTGACGEALQLVLSICSICGFHGHRTHPYFRYC